MRTWHASSQQLNYSRISPFSVDRTVFVSELGKVLRDKLALGFRFAKHWRPRGVPINDVRLGSDLDWIPTQHERTPSRAADWLGKIRI